MSVFFAVLSFSLSVALGLLLLVVLVVLHELGHAIAARRNGVTVEEFGIGFPPQAWSKKLKNGTRFSLNWLPLGGFVKLKGEHDSDKLPGSYGAVSLWSKTKILLAGVVMNWLAAAAIFTALALVGIPKILPNQFSVSQDSQIITQPVAVAAVAPGSPAAAVGLKQGDQLLAVAGRTITSPESLYAATRDNAGKRVTILYRRAGTETALQVTLRPSGAAANGYLGAVPRQGQFIRSTWSAPVVGVGLTAQFTKLTFESLGNLVIDLVRGVASKFSSNAAVRQAGDKALSDANAGVAGPLGILGVIFPAAKQAGWVMLLFLTGIISLTLAVMNILPIPALDGGRLFVTLLFRAIKQPLTKQREDKIHTTGFAALMVLVLLITVLDVGKFIAR